MSGLHLDLESYKSNNFGTHNYHPYPAKYVPQIPRELISRYSLPGQWVLDPFCGSGTTLVEAVDSERNCIGVDVNPLACLISRAKTSVLFDADVIEIVDCVESVVPEALHHSGEPRPVPPIVNIDKWFAPHIQQEVAAIRDCILKVSNDKAKDFLLVALSAILVKVSFQESDTRYRAIFKDLPKGICLKLFSDKVKQMLERAHRDKKVSATCDVVCADATDVVPLKQGIDLVVTSPPYLNSYDYYLYHKHRLAWLGFDHYAVQEREFGSRNKHNDRGLGADSYENSISAHLAGLFPWFRQGTIYACVVGDGIVRGQLHKADEMFDRLFADRGFKKLDQFSFDQRKYTRAFTPNLRTAEKETHVLVYEFLGK